MSDTVRVLSDISVAQFIEFIAEHQVPWDARIVPYWGPNDLVIEWEHERKA